MARPGTQHLSDEELDSLMQVSADSEGSTGGTVPQIPETVRNHLAVCKECGRKLDMHKTIQNALQGARSAKFENLPGQCAEEEKWAEVAAGIENEEEGVRLLEHAAKCNHCGVLLQEAVAILRDGATEEEEALLAGMQSQRREWAEALAPKLKQAAGQEDEPAKRGGWWRMWLRPPALAFVSILVLAAVSWEVARSRMATQMAELSKSSAGLAGGGKAKGAGNPEKSAGEGFAGGPLLAMAYRDYRTMEFRIPGAPFAQMHPVERGAATSVADLPPSVLDATRAVQTGLEGNPTDPRLLDARAQLDLLDGNPGKAIEYLEKAREKDIDSPVILTDLATAYLLSAERSNSHLKNGVALNLLGEVLKKSPNDPVVLYNYALALERLQLYGQAIQGWDAFLSHETDQNWKNDGLAHRDALIQQGLTEDRFKSPAKREPHAALEDLLGRPNGSVERDLDALHDEMYLSVALADWVPEVLQAATSERSRDGPAAIDALARVLREQHHDELLTELMGGRRGPALTKAAAELGAAIRANDRGEISEISVHARNAMALFHEAGNRAGEAAATLQWLSGLSRSHMADRCGAIASAGLKMPDLHRYPWLEGNLLFQAATCDFMTSKVQEALEYSRRAARIAKESRYKILALESAWFLDGVATQWVASHESWNRISAGLDEFWRYPYPAEAGEGFYSDLGYAAQSEGLWYCAEAVSRESLAIHSSHGDMANTAAQHHMLGKAAEAAGDDQTAEAEYREAGKLFSQLGKGNERTQLELSIDKAAVEVRRDRLDEAEATLKDVAPRLDLVSNHYALIPYLAAAGELHLRSGNPQLAEQELRKAIQLVEQNKSSLLSETDLLSWHRDTSQAYRSLLRLYLENYRQDARAFSLLEWYRAAPLRTAAQRKGGKQAQPGESEDAEMAHYLPERTEIGKGSGVLTWIAFPKSLAIFLLDQRGLHTAQIPVTREELELAVQRLARLCADPRSDRNALDRYAQQMYAWLVEPVAPYLEGIQTLTIEPDEGMEVIPFQVLRTGKGEYLGSRMAILESPGMGYAQRLRADKQITPRSMMLAVGDPQQNADARLARLPDASREATAIAASFDRHFLLTGREAVLANVTSRLPQAEVFHFAGHAVSERNQTGLVLASATGNTGMTLLDQEKLRRENLTSLKLVVLSGCETGIAEAGLIDPGNLVRVFLRAEVPNVVASKWKVDSHLSARLLEDTYRGVLRGEPIERAVANAEKSLQSAGLHPYYWAAFSVFGR